MTEDNQPQQPEDGSGYWERKAAEEAAGSSPQPQEPQFNPQSGVPVGDQPAGPPAYPGPGSPYAAPVAGPAQPGHPPAPPGWAPQPAVPGFPVYVLPDHPKATTALIVGLVSIIGGFTCVLPILAAPVAWVIGVQARREIRNAPQQWGGEGRATAGMVLGIIGSVLIVIAILALILVIVLVALADQGGVGSGTGV